MKFRGIGSGCMVGGEMAQEMEPLICLKCGYALQGLPARKCDDCGHVYLRCPECGTSQIANEAQNRLLLQMRARAARLPQQMQVGQMALLTAAGVLWIALGFVFGSNHGAVSITGLAWLALWAAFCASLCPPDRHAPANQVSVGNRFGRMHCGCVHSGTGVFHCGNARKRYDAVAAGRGGSDWRDCRGSRRRRDRLAAAVVVCRRR